MNKTEIIEHLATIRRSRNGWTTELNLVSYDHNEPMYCIHCVSLDREIVTNGIRLTDYDLQVLHDVLGHFLSKGR